MAAKSNTRLPFESSHPFVNFFRVIYYRHTKLLFLRKMQKLSRSLATEVGRPIVVLLWLLYQWSCSVKRVMAFALRTQKSKNELRFVFMLYLSVATFIATNTFFM
jgi:hypothetical protein